jgi:large subunit ribosomal protein L13
MSTHSSESTKTVSYGDSIVMRKTYSPTAGEARDSQEWFVVDAAGLPLGRLAARVAHVLRGKHKPTFAPHIDVGDFVIVVNADQVVLTGRKEDQKVYYRTSGRPGGLKTETAAEMRKRMPVRLVELAVKGMLPKNSLGRSQWRKLKVYAGNDHPHVAQQPKPLAGLPARV